MPGNWGRRHRVQTPKIDVQAALDFLRLAKEADEAMNPPENEDEHANESDEREQGRADEPGSP